MGSSRRQSGAWSRFADVSRQSDRNGRSRSPGGRVARESAAARANDGRARAADGTPARRALRVAVEGPRSRRIGASQSVRPSTRALSMTPKTDAGLRPIPLSELRAGSAADMAESARSGQHPKRSCSQRGPASPSRRTTCCGRGSCRPASRRAAERDVADVPADLLVVGARQGRPGQGRRGDHGPHEGRHDAQRLHAGARRRGA